MHEDDWLDAAWEDRVGGEQDYDWSDYDVWDDPDDEDAEAMPWYDDLCD